MTINQFIKYCIALGVLLGGTDRILGNRFGFGEKFENGFRMLGNIGLSMAGIICLAPLLSQLLGGVVTPLSHFLRIDPGIFGGILSLDMGGYPLALELAQDPALGHFSAVIVSAIFGCTLVFTIPVGLGAIGPDDRADFTRGILLGFVAMPFAIVAGGVLYGLSLGAALWNSFPVLLISALLFVGILFRPEAMLRGFRVFARIIQITGTFGLTLAAIKHISGIELLPGMPDLLDAMETVSSIGITMLGCMPLSELLRRLLKAPCARIRKKTGLNAVSTTALLLGVVSVTPALAMIPEMDRRGKVVCSASLVCGASVFGSHLAFTMNVQPDMVTVLICAKLLGYVLGTLIALFATRKMNAEASTERALS